MSHEELPPRAVVLKFSPTCQIAANRVDKDSSGTEVDLAKSPTAFFSLASLLVGRCSCSPDQPCPMGGTAGTVAHL